MDNKVQVTDGDVHCPTCRNEKCVYISTKKSLVSATVKSAKPAATFKIFLSRTKNRQLCCLPVMVHITLQERRVATTKKRNILHFCKNFPTNHNQAHRNLSQKREKSIHIWQNQVETPLVNAVNQKLFDFFILYTFSLQQSNMIFSVSTDSIE